MADTNYKILCVEDDRVIADQIAQYLETWGYEVTTIKDFSKVLEEFSQNQYHLILMDISLPFYNGFYWCREIRKISKVPIIFLSSASENMNIVMAVNMGGDDFIAKPFDLQVLYAKIQALIRRSYDFTEEMQILTYHELTLNKGTMKLLYRDRDINLSKNEFKIMQLLLEHKGRVITKEDIMKSLWDEECFVDDNTLAVNIARLRKKLLEEGIEDIIRTKKGVGYLVLE